MRIIAIRYSTVYTYVHIIETNKFHLTENIWCFMHVYIRMFMRIAWITVVQ